MKRRNGKRCELALGALLLPLGLGLAGCGGHGANERDRGVLRRVAALLASVPRESIVRLSAADTLHVSASTSRFYRWRLYRSAWTDGETLLPQGEQLYAAIGRARDDGLDPRSYGWDLAHEMVVRLDSTTLSDERRAALLGELDLVLTEGFSRYARDLIQGTVDPRKGGLDWRIPRDTTLEEDVLKAVRTEAADRVVARLRPAVPYYGRLVRALARYRAVEAGGGWPQVPAPERPVRPGRAGGATLVALRRRLLVADDTGESRLARYGEAHPDLFDDSLHAALAHFQSRNAIDEDGALGANTLRELNHSVQDRIADLRLSLDRWRWLPRELGKRYIVVNVAGFELEMIEDGRPMEIMNVVVGKEGWDTPIFSDTMESLIVNPSWNVPVSIARAEVLPALRRDPGYLHAHHFDVVKGERVVDASTVDLSRAGTYRFRQRPGPDNALGRLKFMLPNNDNIYLHDTPAGQLFSRTDRAFSHGCIRVERPQELARALLRRVTDTPPEGLDAILAGGAETTIRFREGVPVYILYFTAWVDEDGTVRFLHDVYGRDEELEPERQRKLEHPAPAGRVAAGSADVPPR
ncbi:MAG TPA: L,D-transpeptidase family protein [Longimicrobiales bacterium]|nr:L,D-transpeptidase family protein [Longimicrobiales bacterium]